MGKAWVIAIGVALMQGIAAAATLVGNANDPVALSGHVLPALDQARTVRLASRKAADTAPLTLTIVLRRTDPAGFDRYLAEVYDPRVRRFRKFLTAQEISDRFGPSRDDFEQVQAYFAQQGFTIVEGSANRMTLAVRAPRTTVESALKIAIGDYAIGDRTFYANVTDPVLPASIAARVQAVIGLSDLARPRPAIISWFKEQPCKEQGDTAGYNAQNFHNGDPYTACTDAVDKCAPVQKLTAAENADAKKVCNKFAPPPPPKALGATPKDLPAGAPPWKDATGAGQKVGLIQFDTFVPSDVANYLELFGMPDSVFANLSQVHVNGGATLGADQSEVLLDVDTVLMAAPDAKVVVYDAPFTGGGSFQGLFNRAISDGMTIISNSWTYCEDQTTSADVQSIDAILATAAAAGISVFNASGDSGSTCLDGSPNTIGVPAGSPHATAVGGTSLKTGPTAVYESETWWNGTSATPPTGQGGFGVSRFFARPLYQDGLTASPMRSIPDIAFSADPANGIIICQASLGSCPLGLSFGGTSAAAPAIAAAAAVLNQAAGHNLGNLNLSLYPLAGTNAFHTAASMGSDFAHVGLGSPNLNKLYLALTSQTVAAVSAAQSNVRVVNNLVAADGTSSAAVVVRLRDGDGNAVSGKTVTLAGSPSGNVVISPASGVSSLANGAAVFHVKNLVVQEVTFTATDTTDNVVVASQQKVTFGVPMAAGGGISASPSPVQNDGVATTTITVILKDALNRPTPAKLVTLSQGTGHSVVSGPSPSVTDANGQIQFTATDTIAETVVYTAVDVTDGNLPIPGSATVVFGGQGSFTCVSGTAPTAAAGYTLTPFSTGYITANLFFGNVNWGCRGAQNPAFAPDGAALVTNFVDGTVFRLPPQGGVADSGAKIATLGPSLFQPVVGKDGKVYAARGATTGDFFTGAIYEIDPVTGAVVRTVLSGLTCPTALVVDPLSGDLFFDDSCFGAGADNPSLWRVANPGGASPTLSVYATLPATPAGWIAFAPDGTIFVPQFVTGSAPVLRISGTDKPTPPTMNPVPGLETVYWVTVGEALGNGAAKSLIVLNGSTFKLADITTNPPTFTDLVNNGTGSGMVGPDGCLYIGGLDTVYKLAPAAGGCGFATTSPAPGLHLTPETASSPQGTQQTLTAQFDNLVVPTDTPVYFDIGDANLQTMLARTDAQGRAAIAYPGLKTGIDNARARATLGATTYRSNTARVTWTAGKHATLLTLNPSPLAGSTGKPLSLRAALADISLSPSGPIAGVAVQFTFGAQSCAATTDAQGVAACAVTPTTGGLTEVVATFAGNASYVAATARAQIAILAGTSSVAAAPIALDFGSVAVGVTSATMSVQLTNAGTLPFALSAIAVSGAQAGDFALVAGANACTAGGSIAANGGTCTLYLTFKPGAAGARGATVTVTDNGAALNFAVPLAGVGISAGGANVAPAPTSLAFGDQLVGTTSAAKTVVLTNTGTVAFALSTIVVSGAQAGDFALASGANACTVGGSIAAGGGACTLYLTFSPTATGPRNATVTASDTGAALNVPVPLSGNGIAPASANVTPAPVSLAFGDQTVGTTSVAMTVVLTNTGAAAFALSTIALSGAQAGDFALASGANACTAGGSIAAGGGTCALYLTFKPGATGPRNATVTASDSGAAQNVAVPLSGNGVGPAQANVTPAPASLAFGDQAVGTTSATKTVVLTNTGTAPFALTFIALSGAQAGDFALGSGVNACIIGGSIAANGGACTLYLSFKPTAAGPRNATVAARDNGAALNVTIPLSGNGLAPASPNVTPAPTSLEFGDQTVGTTSVAKAIVLTNTGTAAFALSAVAVSGAQAGDFLFGSGANACVVGGSLAAGGGACTLYLTFKPGATGARNATITASDSGAALNVAVPLSGNGVAPANANVTPAPTTLAFGDQTVGTTSAAKSIVLTNTGTAAFALSSIAVSGAQAGDFALTSGANACVMGGSLAANGGACTLYLTFKPAAIGARSATVTVTDSVAALDVAVPLNGTGVPPASAAVTPAPTLLAFGDQTVGTTSVTKTIVLINTGTAAFALSGLALSGAQAADFALAAGANACVAGGNVAANGGSCTLYLTFTPTATGARTATVTASDTGAGQNVGVPLSGNGVAPAATCFTGSLPTGGSGTACIQGALPGCQYASAVFVPVASVGVAPPAGTALPYGLFQFTANGCGATATLTLTYPATLPATTVYYKYGPTQAAPTPHWYTLPAAIAGNTLTVTFTDGGAGDSDLAANGTITDPGGAGYTVDLPIDAPIPALDRAALVLLASLLAAMAAAATRRRP